MSNIESNLKKVNEAIDKSARKTNRTLDDIVLVVVTKTRTIEEIKEVYQCGHRIIGENRIQEAESKFRYLKELNLEWHLVGHLQRNKVKDAINIFSMIHSVDSLRLAEEINNRCEQKNIRMNILLEINVSGEETKYGFKPDEIIPALKIISEMKNVNAMGLMTMAPFEANPEDTRPVFRQLRELRDGIIEQNIPNVKMKYLSMGMTNDYTVAIEEGANMVRIGTAIFQS